MSTPEHRLVRKWIEQNFCLNAVQIEPYESLMGGRKVIDRNGDEILVFFDFVTQSVEQIYLDKTKRED